MKKTLILWAALLMAYPAWAQFTPRYLTLEHFTNTLCSLCPGRNNTLFSTLDANPGIIHHFAVHPSVPYSACIFYQHNTAENNNRKDLYGIGGTPQAFVWGEKVWQGSTLLSQAKIDERKGQQAVVGLRVEETDNGNDHSVSVSVRSFDTPPSGNWKLFVAIIERHISYNAPNGEDDHRNVFRDFLQDGSGIPVTLPAAGESETFDFTYAMNPDWDPTEIYVLAFVQDTDTREILNSGTAADLRADLIATPADNGTDGTASAQVNGGATPYTITWDDPANTTGPLAENLAPGVYTATITDANGITMAETVEVTGSVSIAEALQAEFKSAYDPNSQQLKVSIPQPDAGAGILQLYDLRGQALQVRQEIQPNTPEALLPTSGISRGLYLLVFESAQGWRLSRKVQIH